MIRNKKLSSFERAIAAILGAVVLVASGVGIALGTTSSSLALLISGIAGLAISGAFLSAAARGEGLGARRSRRRRS